MTTHHSLPTTHYVDIHSHLNFKEFDEDREAVIARMREAGVATITVGTKLVTSREAVLLAKEHGELFATVGVHPLYVEEGFDAEEYGKLVKENPKVVGVGECGLDYFNPRSSRARIGANEHANDANKMHTVQIEEVKERQKEIFRAQVEFAIRHKLPLVLHCRPSKGSMDAYEDSLLLLEEYKERLSDNPGNSHFFVGDIAVAKRFLALGFTLSFDGPITFARDYDEVVQYVPLDMMHAETDAPYAAPAPYRGKRNEPAYVVEVVKALAHIKGLNEEAVRTQLLTNARRVFKINI